MSKNVSLSIENHMQIYEKKLSKPSMTNPELAQWAKDEFNLSKLPSSSTISKCLKRVREGDTNQTDVKNRKRIRKGKWPVRISI